ncbi:LPXTG cell wall anchor domain-containing protein [Nakamurella antarctica]|uniref:LPXTG cell wall anchor domain-containing protein n=1 Tax=Nakamurella antarctica TaxID=1902245 RepID=A0A3G8ZLS2_9ACTN|nr:LPXTG cell wall anchor domain-containing protein [Nakamurella antarctica]
MIGSPTTTTVTVPTTVIGSPVTTTVTAPPLTAPSTNSDGSYEVLGSDGILTRVTPTQSTGTAPSSSSTNVIGTASTPTKAAGTPSKAPAKESLASTGANTGPFLGAAAGLLGAGGLLLLAVRRRNSNPNHQQ